MRMPLSRRARKKAWLAQEIAAQHKWIEAHGGSMAGYVERYGSKDDAEHSGDGGEAIYTADRNHLFMLCRRYKDL